MDESNGPNHDLFVKVLAKIEKHPELWNQGLFVTRSDDCGTAYCFAGWANVLTGAEDDWDIVCDKRAGEQLGIPEPPRCSEGGWDTESGWYSDLFSACNSLDAVYRISADILGIDEQVLRDKVAAEVAA